MGVVPAAIVLVGVVMAVAVGSLRLRLPSPLVSHLLCRSALAVRVLQQTVMVAMVEGFRQFDEARRILLSLVVALVAALVMVHRMVAQVVQAAVATDRMALLVRRATDEELLLQRLVQGVRDRLGGRPGP